MKGKYQLPVLIEKDEDGFYVAECIIFSGCYSQGKTKEEALSNLKEVIQMCIEEKENMNILENFKPRKISFETLSYV